MKWLYFAALAAAGVVEVPRLWKRGCTRAATAWVLIALLAVGLAALLFWGPDGLGLAELILALGGEGET